MSVRLEIPAAGEEQSSAYEMVQPAQPNEDLMQVGSCVCRESIHCPVHSYVSVQEVAEAAKDRLNAPQFQGMTGGKILCYRSKIGWVPELRDIYNDEDEIRTGISRRVKLVTERGQLFRGGTEAGPVLERFADPAGDFPPSVATGSRYVLTGHDLPAAGMEKDVHGRFPHDYSEQHQPGYLRIAKASKVVVPKKPDLAILRHLDSEPLPFKSFPTDAQTIAVFDPQTKTWKSQVLPAGELGADHWERMYHYPDGFITGMVYYKGKDGIYGFRVDQHILRACRDAKRRGFEGVTPEFLQKLFSSQLSADQRWVPSVGNQPGNRYYGRFIGYPTNTAPPLRGKEKELLFLGTPVGPYRNVKMLNIRQMGPRPVVKGFGDVKHVTNYAGPVEIFAPHQDAGYHEAMFMAEHEGRERVQEGTSVNYAFVSYFGDRGPTIRIPSLKHGDILPGITMQSVADLALSYGYQVITDEDISQEDIAHADEILVTGTAMTVRGVQRIDGRDGQPVFESKIDGDMGPFAKRLAGDFELILKQQHPDPYFQGWMQKIS